ncbi:hypothetical protein G9A89_007153 [Geosiphon pyriformis]|nr:hypothetical protein G9A89_007153 [Geosiphon pyriformis]
MPPQIPVDILPIILGHFVGELEEQEILHDLLFVNKTWTHHILPLLWNNPFLYCQQQEKRVKLVSTCIGSLSDHDKAVLHGLIPNLEIQPPSLMNYIDNITVLEEKNMIESVKTWYNAVVPIEKSVYKGDGVETQSEGEIAYLTSVGNRRRSSGPNINAISNNGIENERKYEVTVLTAMLYKLFVEQSRRITWLNLDCDVLNAAWYDGTIIHQDYMADKILESIAKYQQSLVRLAVVFNSCIDRQHFEITELGNLVVECIKVQGRYLGDFIIENAAGPIFGEMHHALRPRASSLKRVGYKNCDFANFPWAVGIEILSQTQEIYFISCTNLDDNKLALLEVRMERPFQEFYYYILKGLDD